MKDTYLVQRLNKPVSNTGMEMFSFGGGLKNGGLSGDAMKLLRPIFSFDYMGSSVAPKVGEHSDVVRHVADVKRVADCACPVTSVGKLSRSLSHC